LRAGHISLDVAKALTLARDDTEQLSVLTAARSGRWSAHQVRNALTKETLRSDDRKVLFVGLEDYENNGGTMDADLFEDQTYLHDSDLIDRLFAAKLETETEALRVEQGWSWAKSTTDTWVPHAMYKDLTAIYRTEVELPEADQVEFEALSENDRLTTDGQKRLDELQTRADGDFTDEDRETGGIIARVDHKGKLTVDQAYREPFRSKNNTNSTTGLTPKPALTQAGAEDLRRIQLMALQGAMIDKTEFLLDLFAWQIERAAPSWSSPFAISLTHQNITPEADGSWHIAPRLSDSDSSDHDINEDPAATFKAFQAKGKKHRNQIIARGLTRTLQLPSPQMAPFARLMTEFAGVDIRKVWTPDAPTYFSRLSTPAMETLWAELLEAEPDDDRVVAFAKLKKRQKATELADLFANAEVQETLGLTRDQIARIDAWLPEELRNN
jgi:ParB family transcriptional regulator, chromosome partitioning protein